MTAAVRYADEGNGIPPISGMPDRKASGMNDDVSPALGISRRDVLRRGAVVGGTLVWAAPAVQTISRSALAQTNGTPEPGDCHAISYLALVLTNGQTFQFKIEAGGNIESEVPMEAPHCGAPPGWNATGNIGGFPPGTTWDITDDCCWSVTVPAGYTLVGVAMGAGGDHTEQGYCVQHSMVTNGLTYTFCAPPK